MKIALILLLLTHFSSFSQIAIPPVIERPLPPDTPISDDSIISFITCDAQFPGGILELKRHIQNYQHVSNWNDSLDSKRGYVGFVVEINGTLTDIKLMRGINPELDDIMLRIVEEMPNWIPACDGNGPIRSRVRMPITFIRPK